MSKAEQLEYKLKRDYGEHLSKILVENDPNKLAKSRNREIRFGIYTGLSSLATLVDISSSYFPIIEKYTGIPPPDFSSEFNGIIYVISGIVLGFAVTKFINSVIIEKHRRKRIREQSKLEEKL